MQLTDDLEFSHRDRKDIYEYVEGHGTVDYDEARQALRMDETAFGHHVAIMKRDGVLEQTDDGDLRVAFERGEEETHAADGIEYQIRQAREEDLTGLVGAIRAAIDEKTYIEAESMADVLDHQNVLLRHNALESRMFFVATVDNEVVGWVHLNVPEMEKLDHTAELTIGVLEEYRGHGIGSHLLERGTKWATTSGVEKLYSSVPSTNETAIEWLQSHGWETEAVREDHYKLEGEYIDEVMMAYHL
ncbi:MAG: N-acetyltransferase family protein [Haloarculaceae archaeon]